MPSYITNANLAQQISDLLAKWQTRETQMQAWIGGTATGGPFANGTYPLTDVLGNTVYTLSPAALSLSVTGLATSASAYASAAAASATAAAGSATAAAASAATATTQAATSTAQAVLSATAASNALSSQGNALSFANAALASQTAAATSATNAASSASAASGSASAAAGSATAAAASATAAAASATLAATFNPALFAALAGAAFTGGITGTTASFTGALTAGAITASPSSGTALTVNGVSGSNAIVVSSPSTAMAIFNGSGTSGGYLTWQSAGTSIGDIGAALSTLGFGTASDMSIAARGAHSIYLSTQGNNVVQINASGTTFFNAAASVPGIVIDVAGAGASNQNIKLTASGATSATYGMGIDSSNAFFSFTRLDSGHLCYEIGLNGQLVWNAPTSGVALTINTASGSPAISSATIGGSYYIADQTGATVALAMNSSGANYGQVFNKSSQLWALGYNTSNTTPGTAALTWNSSGQVAIPAATSAALTVGDTSTTTQYTRLGQWVLATGTFISAGFAELIADEGRTVYIGATGASASVNLCTNSSSRLQIDASGNSIFFGNLALNNKPVLYSADATVNTLGGKVSSQSGGTASGGNAGDIILIY